MDLENIVGVINFVVALILGYFAKKSNFIKNEMIPIQNVIVGVLVAVIEWIITKDFNEAIILSGLIAGGTYDIFHNLQKIVKNNT